MRKSKIEKGPKEEHFFYRRDAEGVSEEIADRSKEIGGTRRWEMADRRWGRPRGRWCVGSKELDEDETNFGFGIENFELGEKLWRFSGFRGERRKEGGERGRGEIRAKGVGAAGKTA
jgi:hypothetical protein